MKTPANGNDQKKIKWMVPNGFDDLLVVFFATTYTEKRHKSWSKHVASHAHRQSDRATVVGEVALLLLLNHANSMRIIAQNRWNPLDHRPHTFFVSIVNRMQALTVAKLSIANPDPTVVGSFWPPPLLMGWRKTETVTHQKNLPTCMSLAKHQLMEKKG